MKKNELRNSDIVVTRDGFLGVVILDETYACIMYPETGTDFLDSFDDDLIFILEKDTPENDIMAVYRYVDFKDVDDENNLPIWERDYYWERPSKEERQKKLDAWFNTKYEMSEEDRIRAAEAAEARKKTHIKIITQHFYGNRTGTEIPRDCVNNFIRGNLNFNNPDEENNVNLKIVRVPNSDNIVIVYDHTQEEEYVNIDLPEIYKEHEEDYFKHTGRKLVIPPSCEIPEIGFKIYTRCFACRIDGDGEFQSLEENDGEKFIEYFTK